MENITHLHIIWEDIFFKKDYICFHATRLKLLIEPVKQKGIIESLNLVKGEYFNRIYGRKAFKLAIRNGIVVREQSPGWNSLLDAIEFAMDIYHIQFAKKERAIIKKHQSLSKQEVQDLYDPIISHSEYLKYLAQRLDTEFKLIPVLEFSNGQLEDSFLFRFRNNRGHVLIVWENVKTGRATYVFKYEEAKHFNILEKIESFIMSEDYHKKRSLLSGTDRAARIIKQELCFYKKYPHKGFMDFRSEIEYLIGYS